MFNRLILFAAPWYLLKSRQIARDTLVAEQRTEQAIIETHREAMIVQFAAMAPEQQVHVVEALRSDRRAAVKVFFIKWLVLIAAAIAVVVWFNS